MIERMRASLAADPPHDLLAGDLIEGSARCGHQAAVLVAITDRPEPGVMLTVRREHLRTHAGQVAFPGGRIDPGEDAVAAALREAEEELGLDPALRRDLGDADPYRTVTGYCVTPGARPRPARPRARPAPQEVADWFEAPLDLRARSRQPAADDRRISGPHARIIIRSTGKAAASGARPPRCWSI